MHDAILARRLSVAFGLQMQVAVFFALLILNEFVGPEEIKVALGLVDTRTLAYRLRKALAKTRPEIAVGSRRSIGYWIAADIRHNLKQEFEHAIRSVCRVGPEEVAEQPPHAIRI